MNFVQILATLRKLGNYLAGLFPALVVIAEWFADKAKTMCAHPKVAPIIEHIASKPWIAALWSVIERFYWRNYAKDRLNLTESPAETLLLLRPVLQLCVLLCLLIPLTQFDLWMVPVETMSGFKSSISAWAVILFCLTLPFGWGAVLAGTGISNRLAFLAAALSCLYFMATCAFFLPRSYWNGLLALTVLIAFGFSERTLKQARRNDWLFGVLSCLIIGSTCGIQLTAMTPLRELVSGFASIFPTIPVSLVVGPPLGVVLSLVAFKMARRTARSQGSANPSQAAANAAVIEIPSPLPFASFSVAVWTSIALLLAYSIAALCRAGTSTAGGLALSSVTLSNTYLWPAWYFIGVGIILKLMGHSRTVAKAIDAGMNPRALSPILITVLILLALCAFSERLITILQYEKSAAAQYAYQFFLFFWQASSGSIWSVPLNAMLADWFSWVLLLDVVLVLVLFFIGRLTNEVLTRLAYLTCLAGLLIWEYLFQLSSFARSPSHSVTAVFLFCAWLLWLMHTVGWEISTQSSPRWPSRGRFAIYCGITLFILLEIFGRTATRDWRVSNEIFLSMFRGVIDFGLPYFMYLYTRTRVPNLPLQTGTIFGAYLAGALASLCLNALDKLSLAQWSLSQLGSLIQIQVDQLSNIGSINLDVGLSPGWLFVRSLIYIGCLICVERIFHSVQVVQSETLPRSETVLLSALASSASASSPSASSPSASSPSETIKATGPVRHSAQWSFAARASKALMLVAFASGVASFASTLVDLPIPKELRVLTAPLIQEVTFNENVFRTFLGYWLAALILGAALVSERFRGKVHFLYALIASILLCFAASGLYQQHGVWLRATGILTTAILFSVALLVLLIAFIVHRLDLASRPAEASGDERSEEGGQAAEVAADISSEAPSDEPRSPSDRPTTAVAKSNLAVPAKPDAPGPLTSDLPPVVIPYPVLCLMLATAMVGLLGIAFVQAGSLPLRQVHISSLSKTVTIPIRWRAASSATPETSGPSPQSDQQTIFYAHEQDGTTSQLIVVPVASHPSGPKALLKRLFEDSSRSGFPPVTPISLAGWGRLTGRSGAAACYFSFERQSPSGPIPRAGLTVLVPVENERTEVYTLLTNPTDLDREQWQLAQIVQSSSATLQPGRASTQPGSDHASKQ